MLLDLFSHCRPLHLKICRRKTVTVRIHSAVPVLSERTRYIMFMGFTPPWMRVWNMGGDGSADYEVVAAAEGELKEILHNSHAYSGQYDALQGKL